jgi:ABC-2 type transport system ATP-binding protein
MNATSPPAVHQALVDIRHVTKSFGAKIALNDISFSIPAGQLCGLLGPSGAGKTTLFRLLMGILQTTDGTLLVDGHDAFVDRVAVKKLVGFLPDEPIFYSYLSGREILELSAALHGLDVNLTMERLTPLIARLRLADDLLAYAYEDAFSRSAARSDAARRASNIGAARVRTAATISADAVSGDPLVNGGSGLYSIPS